MSEQRARRLMSSNSLKLVAGGVSLLALALLAVLAVGFFSTGPEPTPSPLAPTAEAPNSRTTAALPSDAAIEGPTTQSKATPYPPGDDGLRSAIWRGELDTVKQFIAAGSRLNASDSKGNPYLREAVWRGHDEVVRVLAAAGADVNALDSRNNPLLHSAVWRDNSSMVQVLVDAGADIDARDGDGDPLLHEAIWRGHREVARILVNAGADVNARDSKGDPLLHEAIWRGHKEIARILVNAGADVNARDSKGDPLLQEGPFQRAHRYRADSTQRGGHGIAACEFRYS